MFSAVWKCAPYSEIFNLGWGGQRSHTVQDLVWTERVWALVFLLRLKAGGFFGTILANTFFVFKFVVKICLDVSLSIFKCSAIILMPKWRSVLTQALTFPKFSSVFVVIGWPVLSSFSRSSLPLHLKSSCVIQTRRALDKLFSLYASRNKLKVSKAVLFNFTWILM
jgi:hypothetical protein